MKILIVDDEPQVAEILAKSLAREGHDATVAHSGEEALRRRPALPVVVITGHATEDEVDQVKQLGAIDVIEKPAPLTHYQGAIRRLDLRR